MPTSTRKPSGSGRNENTTLDRRDPYRLPLTWGTTALAMVNTESHFQSKLLKALRRRLPKATIWKPNDRFTSGIPDVVVIYGSLTTFLELKVGRRAPTILQWETLKRLERGYLVAWRDGRWQVTHAASARIALGNTFEGLVNELEELCQR